MASPGGPKRVEDDPNGEVLLFVKLFSVRYIEHVE